MDETKDGKLESLRVKGDLCEPYGNRENREKDGQGVSPEAHGEVGASRGCCFLGDQVTFIIVRINNLHFLIYMF